MSDLPPRYVFRPHPPDAAGVLSWVQVGDLHMRSAGEQNHVDLQAIVEEVSVCFAGSISFVFLPGDNADHGDAPAYRLVRQAMDRLQVPWCAIVGDHDVEQKSVGNFTSLLYPQTHYSFTVGAARLIALNAFDIPEPPAFTMLAEQLCWLEAELQAAVLASQATILLLHCYPSDLKQGGDVLSGLVSSYGVKLIAMGHTHYNEIAHDRTTIYTATRSTGQIEEGPVGFSVTNLDDGVVSWRFLELGALPSIIITAPADERLLADQVDRVEQEQTHLRIRAKGWSRDRITSVAASLGDETVAMDAVAGSQCWEVLLACKGRAPGIHPLRVTATDSRGKTAVDEIQALIGPRRPSQSKALRDQDNVLGAWPEHGLLGTQLGPNKNGRKW